MLAYYNEIEPSAVLWLKAAMDAGHIVPGEIDTRPIQEVESDDLKGYTQHHFFAGIGGWSIALRLAGWPDDRPVWTGSCPCQPFSAAGQRQGKADERHLWPIWGALIRSCRPPVIFGEQVSSAINSGTIPTEKEVQELLRRKGLIELLLAEHTRPHLSPPRLQKMRNCEEDRAPQTRKRAESEAQQGLEEKKQGYVLESHGGNESEEEGDPLHDNGGMGARDNRCRGVPTHRDTVQSSGEQVMGLPIVRSDYSWQWLHTGEYESCSVLGQCDDEQLGRTENYTDNTGYYEAAKEKIQRAARTVDREIARIITHGWWDEVAYDLEAQGYACGAAVLPACSVGAAHRRDRLWFVANGDQCGCGEKSIDREYGEEYNAESCGIMGNTKHDGQPATTQRGSEGKAICGGKEGQNRASEFEGAGNTGNVADTEQPRLEGQPGHEQGGCEPGRLGAQADGYAGAGDTEWIECPDGKQRPVKSGLCLLVDGLPGRLRKAALHGFGNAIVPAVAAEFIRATNERKSHE